MVEVQAPLAIEHTMMNPALRPDPSLPEVLAARARATPDGRLVADVVAGLLAGLGVAVWRPVAWVSLLCVCVALAAFGLWGILDRELRERHASPRHALARGLRAARALVTAVGVVSAAGALFAALGVLLGTWIS
jgi:hypothetical protein